MLLQVGAQGVVHAGLPAFASRAERLKHVSVIADADLFFRFFLRGPTHATGRAEWLQFGDLTRAQFIRVRVGADAVIDCRVFFRRRRDELTRLQVLAASTKYVEAV